MTEKAPTALKLMDSYSVLEIKTLRAGSWLHVTVFGLHWFGFETCVVRLSVVDSFLFMKTS